eukprot:8041-Heterococcus_DN1.PRE.4
MTRHDATFLQLGRVLQLQGNHKAALATYDEALEFSPESAELLTTVGLLHLRLGNHGKAFECLGSALTHDPRNPKAILAAGSIIQDNEDMVRAVVELKLRLMHLFKRANIIVCSSAASFAGCVVADCCTCQSLSLTTRYPATVRCTATTSHCTGTGCCTDQVQSSSSGHTSQCPAVEQCWHVLLWQEQASSSSVLASINLKADHAASYMYLGLTLSRLDDIDNACSAYDKALELQPLCTLTLLNYATSLLTHAADDSDAARVSTLLEAAEAQLQQQSESSKADNSAQMVTHCEQLRAALTAHSASISVTTNGASIEKVSSQRSVSYKHQRDYYSNCILQRCHLLSCVIVLHCVCLYTTLQRIAKLATLVTALLAAAIVQPALGDY